MKRDPKKITEKYVKNRVGKLLKKYGCYRFMPVQTGYGSATLDYLCCHKGRFFAIETKAPKKHLTPRQELIKTEIEEAEGPVFIIGEEAIYKAGEDTNGLGVRKLDTFSGMMELECWLLLGP